MTNVVVIDAGIVLKVVGVLEGETRVFEVAR